MNSYAYRIADERHHNWNGRSRLTSSQGGRRDERDDDIDV